MTGTCSQGPDTLANVAEPSTDLRLLRFLLIGSPATTDTGQTPRSEAELLLKLNRQARLQIVSLQSLPVWNAGVDDDNDNDDDDYNDNDDDYNDLSRSGTPRSALGSATSSEIGASTSVTLLHTGRTLGGLRVNAFFL